MNFCQNCGTDLRSHQNVKFCFNCGVELTLENINSSNILEKARREKKDELDNFDYFDFPESENDLRQFISHLEEHIAINSSLTRCIVGEKYLERGKEYLDACSLCDYNLDKFTGKWSYPSPSEKEVSIAAICFYLANEFCENSESLYQLWGYYYFIGQHKKAQQYLIIRAEKIKEKLGIEDWDTFEFAVDAYDFTTDNKKNNDLEELPYWIYKIGFKNDTQDLPI